jgi:glycosyltransferase involved in cell wall biosynthesis
MRIAINGRFGPRITGVGRVIVEYVRALCMLGRPHDYIVYANPEYVDVYRALAERILVVANGVPADNPIANHLWTQFILPGQLRRDKADVLVLPQIALHLWSQVPTVLIQHDLVDMRIPSHEWYRRLFRRVVYSRSLKMAHRIVSVSENTTKDIGALFPSVAGKVVTIPNGVDSRFSPQELPSERERVHEWLGFSRPYSLFVGTLTHPQKNIVNLIRGYALAAGSISQMPDLVLVGQRGKDYSRIIREVDASGLASRIHVKGYADDGLIPPLMRQAEFVAFLSLYEGFGLPALEAMACGAPVLASNRSSLPEIVGDGGIVVDPEDLRQIAQAMIRLVSDRDLRRQLSVRAIQQASRFNWTKSAERLLDVIEEVGARGSARMRSAKGR